jgi:TolA protein
MSSDVMDQKFFTIPATALIASLLIHLAVPGLLVGFHILDSMGLFPFFRKKMDLHQTYQNFIQVDVVALPDELPNEKGHVDLSVPIVDKPRATPEPVEAPAKDEMELKAEKADEAKKKDALRKSEEMAQEKARKKEEEKALKKLKEEADREAALKAIAPAEGKKGRQKLSGNILSKGAATTGKLGTAKDQYNALVAQAIKDHFNIYPWQKKKKLLSVAHIELYPNGRVRTREILKSSADKSYDSAVLSAIDQAQPLPLPSDPSVIADGITISITPE